jgi:cellulose biosynthesis protein BcsQ
VDTFASRAGRRDLAVLPFLSMVDRRKAMHREILERCHADPRFLEATVPAASVVEKMGLHRAPLMTYAGASEAAQAFAALWDELAKRMALRV